RNLVAQRAPLTPRPVRAERLLQPEQVKLLEPRRLIERLPDRPALVDVDRERMLADQLPQIPQIAAVALGTEADLQLEGAMAAPHRPFRGRDAAIRIDAAGIGAQDRKSTRLNSSHRTISYAVFCL